MKKKTVIINFIKIIVFSLFRKFSLDLLKEPFEVTFLIIYLVFYALFCRGLPILYLLTAFRTLV